MTSRDEFLQGISAISCAQRVYEAQKPTWGDWPSSLHPQLVQGLEKIGAGRPYLHQAQTIKAAMSGQDVALVTGTASGKTLSFVVPAFQAMLQDPAATTLLLYPTKALSWDQYGSALRLKDALGDAAASINIEKYDGDMAQGAKNKVRTKGANFLLTNPDEIHAAVLQHHHLWKDFLTNLKYVVIDEVHAYSGFFGSNVALVLHRLLALCERYGGSPTCIAASATILNAQELVGKMIDRPVVVVDGDTAGSPTKHLVLIDANAQYEQDDTSDLGQDERRRKTPESLVLEIVEQAIDVGLRGLVFANTRQTAEDLVAKARHFLPDEKAARIAVYRSGLAADVRRGVEAGLKNGDLAFVVSTNALELGIDVGDLDICVLYGMPQTNAEAWQRLGRVGRKPGHEAIGIAITMQSSWDIECLNDPAAFFDGRTNPESVIINPENTELKRLHDACAAFETVDAEATDQGDSADELKRDRFRAYGTVHLRNIVGSREIVVVDGEERTPIGVIDAGAAPREAYPGAVYVHGGERYRIVKWEVGRSRSALGDIVAQREMDETARTIPQRTTRFDVDFRCSTTRFQAAQCSVCLFVGDIGVNAKTVAYLELDRATNRMKRHRLASPIGVSSRSRGIGFSLGGIGANNEEILRALGSLIAIYMMRTLSCGRSDIHLYTTEYCWDLDTSALFIVESHAGNLGYADAVFQEAATFLRAAQWIARTCKCQDGCSRCIYAEGSWRKTSGLHVKARVVEVLESLINEGLDPLPWALPRAPTRPARDDDIDIDSNYQGCGSVVNRDVDGVTIERPSGQLISLPWKDLDTDAITDEHHALRLACVYFRRTLERQPRVVGYLLRRNIKWHQLQSDFEFGGNDKPLYALDAYLHFYPHVIDLLMGSAASKRVDVLRPAVVAPLRDEKQELVGVQLRRCDDDKSPRYVTRFHDPKKKEEHLYGLHLDLTRSAAAQTSQLILCKGIFDCWACHQDQHPNAVATLGDGITRRQMKRVKQLGVKEIVLGFTSEKEIGIARALARGDFDLVVSRTTPDHDLDEARTAKTSIAKVIEKRVEILDASTREKGQARVRHSHERLEAEIEAHRYFIFPVDDFDRGTSRRLITALEKERNRKRARADVPRYVKVPHRFVDSGLHKDAGAALSLLLYLHGKKTAIHLPVSIKVETLADALGLSESAINKQAQRLRGLGLLVSIAPSTKSLKHAWDWYPLFMPVK